MYDLLVRVASGDTTPIRRVMQFEKIPEETQEVYFPEIDDRLIVFLKMNSKTHGAEIWCLASAQIKESLKEANPEWKYVTTCIGC